MKRLALLLPLLVAGCVNPAAEHPDSDEPVASAWTDRYQYQFLQETAPLKSRTSACKSLPDLILGAALNRTPSVHTRSHSTLSVPQCLPPPPADPATPPTAALAAPVPHAETAEGAKEPAP